MISSKPVCALLFFAGLLASWTAYGAPDEPPPPPPPSPPQDTRPYPVLPPQATRGTLDHLVGPIALYPDPLIALILPASTVPGDISAAAAYEVQYGDTSRIDEQPWDPSVRALAHYPAVVTWMAENMPWTQALGAAFLASPPDVMASIQGLRARALASGILVSTPQQKVVTSDGNIEIVPAQADLIFVPAYDAAIVYSDSPYDSGDGPPVNFGPPCPAGDWLSFGVDWHRHELWDLGAGAWRGSGGWHSPPFGHDHVPKEARPWNPPAGSAVRPASGQPVSGRPPEPAPMTGAPVPAASRIPASGSNTQRGGTPANPTNWSRLPPENPAAPARDNPGRPGGDPPKAGPAGGSTQAREPASAQPSRQAPAHESPPAESRSPQPSGPSGGDTKERDPGK